MKELELSSVHQIHSIQRFACAEFHWIFFSHLPRRGNRLGAPLVLLSSLSFFNFINHSIEGKSRRAPLRSLWIALFDWISCSLSCRLSSLRRSHAAAAGITHPKTRQGEQPSHQTPAAIVHSKETKQIKDFFNFFSILNMAGAPTSSTNQSNQLFSFSKRKDWIWFGVVDGGARLISSIPPQLIHWFHWFH